MLLSMVTVTWPGTLGGTARWVWPEAGAGAISLLGMAVFRAAWKTEVSIHNTDYWVAVGGRVL